MGTGREIAIVEPNGSTVITPREQVGGLLRPVAPPADVLAAQNETRQLVKKALKEGRDYGVIPGTDKPTLYKPGAERINAAFGCSPRYRIITAEIDHDREVEWTKRKKDWYGPKGARKYKWVAESGVSRGLYRYVVECELEHRGSGAVIGQGIASASTMESKYVENPRDKENTVLKMGEKRAFIGATLNAFGLSDEFTQDVEDMPPDDDVGPAAPPRESKPEGASTGQVDEIRLLLQAEVITEEERARFKAALTKGITTTRADEAVEWLKGAINERMSADQPEHPDKHPALTQAKQVYRAALEECRSDLLYDTRGLAKFEEETIGRTSSEDWLASEYLRCAEAVRQSEAPETDDEAA